MKVFDLCCTHGHSFEGWFASEEDYLGQHDRGLVECPFCGDRAVARRPSAPRLNFGAVEPREVVAAPAARSEGADSVTLQGLWVEAVKHVLARTEDVGERFPEEARRIHYGEAKERGIRGQATPDQRAALEEEGIEVMALPVPAALKGPAH
jgi:hypothetical protein